MTDTASKQECVPASPKALKGKLKIQNKIDEMSAEMYLDELFQAEGTWNQCKQHVAAN